MTNLFGYYEEYIYIILIVHLVISVVLAFVISIYALKRFEKSSKKIDAKDALRLTQTEDKSWFYKLLFKASLHKNNQIGIFIFTLFFNISIPFLGYFFTLWLFWYMVNVKYEKQVLDTNILDLDEFKNSFLKVERVFGEGSMINMMNNAYVPKSKKLKALATLASYITPISLQIVKQTLSSKDDEIRMFGYAVINKAEKQLNEKMNAQLAIIAEEVGKGEQKDKEKIAFAAKELAHLYWEMVYAELAHDSLKVNFLNSVITYINIAKDYYLPHLDEILEQIRDCEKNDAELKNLQAIRYERQKLEETYLICSSLFTLMGRVYMHRNEYELAKAEFTVAKELLNKRSTFLIPYLAEVYFVTGKFNIVSSLINQTKGLEFNARLYPIIQQWKTAS
ncbi:hypothetical protein [Sulfurimonas sp.]|uniref:hypothetical protein n=1 Tax=Sulfurimonas sp. TaxID=2022749 RepID=UPI0026263578|nr:hypothetical protein [Sulfurimonas sp.]